MIDLSSLAITGGRPISVFRAIIFLADRLQNSEIERV